MRSEGKGVKSSRQDLQHLNHLVHKVIYVLVLALVLQCEKMTLAVTNLALLRFLGLVDYTLCIVGQGEGFECVQRKTKGNNVEDGIHRTALQSPQSQVELCTVELGSRAATKHVVAEGHDVLRGNGRRRQGIPEGRVVNLVCFLYNGCKQLFFFVAHFTHLIVVVCLDM